MQPCGHTGCNFVETCLICEQLSIALSVDAASASSKENLISANGKASGYGGAAKKFKSSGKGHGKGKNKDKAKGKKGGGVAKTNGNTSGASGGKNMTKPSKSGKKRMREEEYP
jgi:hypothetical protein